MWTAAAVLWQWMRKVLPGGAMSSISLAQSSQSTSILRLMQLTEEATQSVVSSQSSWRPYGCIPTGQTLLQCCFPAFCCPALTLAPYHVCCRFSCATSLGQVACFLAKAAAYTCSSRTQPQTAWHCMWPAEKEADAAACADL